MLKVIKGELEVINQNQRKAQHWQGLGFGGGNLVKKIVYYNPALISMTFASSDDRYKDLILHPLVVGLTLRQIIAYYTIDNLLRKLVWIVFQ